MWLTRPRRESLQAGKAQRLAKINGQTQRKGTPTDRQATLNGGKMGLYVDIYM